MYAFFETHTYKGGFQAELIPNISRPAFLPPANYVGLRSTEAELAVDDYAIELTTFPSKEHTVWWLGCYTRGLDLIYGDRGTYCGVGIWLIDTLLWHSIHMISFLRGATARIAFDNRVTEETAAKLSNFLDRLSDLAWCVPSEPDPDVTTDGGYAPSTDRTAYIILPNSQKPTFNLAAMDILQQLFTNSAPLNYERRLYLLTQRSRLHVCETETLPYNDAQAYADHINSMIDAQANSAIA